MAGISETRLNQILDNKFEAQNKILEAILKPYEEARLQVWKNEKKILTMDTEKKTIKWGLVFIYTGVASVISVVTAVLTALVTFGFIGKI